MFVVCLLLRQLSFPLGWRKFLWFSWRHKVTLLIVNLVSNRIVLCAVLTVSSNVVYENTFIPCENASLAFYKYKETKKAFVWHQPGPGHMMLSLTCTEAQQLHLQPVFSWHVLQRLLLVEQFVALISIKCQLTAGAWTVPALQPSGLNTRVEQRGWRASTVSYRMDSCWHEVQTACVTSTHSHKRVSNLHFLVK